MERAQPGRMSDYDVNRPPPPPPSQDPPPGWPPPPPGPAPEPAPVGVPPQRHRRLRGPRALIAAVAVAAAAIGGGAGALIGAAYDSGSGGGTSAGSSAVPGEQTATGTNGVSGVADKVSPSVVEISAASGQGEATGSGVVISEDGEILTNNHVVSGAEKIEITFKNGRTTTAEIVGTEPDLDIALIKAQDVQGLTPAALGDSDQVGVGDEVVAFGSPEGLTGTVTSGIISSKDRDVTVQREDGERGQQSQEAPENWPFQFDGGEYNGDVGSDTTTYKALQTDASLNPGNSGGPLVDMKGRVIGINSANSGSGGGGDGSSAGGGGSVGLGFAVPVNDVKQILGDLRADAGQ